MPCTLSAQDNNAERFISDSIFFIENRIAEKNYENELEKKFLEGQIEGYQHSLIIIRYFQHGSV